MTDRVDLTINDLTASYTPGEQKIMRDLVRSSDPAAPKTLALIHECKALCDAHILTADGYPA